MRYDKLDVIKLSLEQVEKLMDWKNNNKDVVRAFKTILEEGLIQIGTYAYIHFIDNDDVIMYKYVDKEHHEVMASFIYYRNEKTITDFEVYKITKIDRINKFIKEFLEDEEKIELFILDTITVHASTMAYMQYCKKEVIEIQNEVKLTRKEQERVNRDRKYSNVITIKTHKTVYKFPESNKIKTRELTKREIKASAWNVRGHMRKLKNGKETFIKPYVKGKDKDKLKGKQYKFDL
jgi:hypothetical protein